MRGKPISSEGIQKVLNLLQSDPNKSSRSIARELGLTATTVNKIRRGWRPLKRSPLSLAARLDRWSVVCMDTGCILWTAGKYPGGYGRLQWQGRGQRTHRLAYCLHNNLELSAIRGLYVCHKCDTPECINPEHLFLGTGADNMRDCSRKGMIVHGARHRCAKLDDKRVVKALRLIKSGESTASVARRFGVSRAAMRMIRIGHTWKHIDREAI